MSVWILYKSYKTMNIVGAYKYKESLQPDEGCEYGMQPKI
jgi:hypothetical protein